MFAHTHSLVMMVTMIKQERAHIQTIPKRRTSLQQLKIMMMKLPTLTKDLYSDVFGFGFRGGVTRYDECMSLLLLPPVSPMGER